MYFNICVFHTFFGWEVFSNTHSKFYILFLTVREICIFVAFKLHFLFNIWRHLNPNCQLKLLVSFKFYQKQKLFDLITLPLRIQPRYVFSTLDCVSLHKLRLVLKKSKNLLHKLLLLLRFRRINVGALSQIIIVKYENHFLITHISCLWSP